MLIVTVEELRGTSSLQITACGITGLYVRGLKLNAFCTSVRTFRGISECFEFCFKTVAYLIPYSILYLKKDLLMDDLVRLPHLAIFCF